MIRHSRCLHLSYFPKYHIIPTISPFPLAIAEDRWAGTWRLEQVKSHQEHHAVTNSQVLKRGPWSDEESERLNAFILKHGHHNWRSLPKLAVEFAYRFFRMMR
ncbi:hypothetical protein YC2023_038642 [Brassica napus]